MARADLAIITFHFNGYSRFFKDRIFLSHGSQHLGVEVSVAGGHAFRGVAEKLRHHQKAGADAPAAKLMARVSGSGLPCPKPAVRANGSAECG